RDGEVDGGADAEPVVVRLPPVVWIPPGAVDATVVADDEQVQLIGIPGYHADGRARRDVEVGDPPKRIYFAQQLLEPVAELTVPRQKLRAKMHVRPIVDLVLLEPIADAARGELGEILLFPWVVHLIQCEKGVLQPGSFILGNPSNIFTNTGYATH